MFKVYFNSGIDYFLRSNYVNNIINKNGFIAICNVIKDDLTNIDTKRLVSQILLNHSAVVDEFEKYYNFIKEGNEFSGDQIALYGYSSDNDPIKMLSIFGSIEAIKFYREIIKDAYSKLYRDSFKGLNRECLEDFVEYDVIVSPFTSFPRNVPPYLLSYRPFERIYDDAYILNESDYEVFIKRAYVIYSHFIELFYFAINDIRMNKADHWGEECANLEYRIVVQGEDGTGDTEDLHDDLKHAIMRYDMSEKVKNYLEIILGLAFQYWNVASYRFDAIMKKLKEPGPRKYHIISNIMGIQIIDLQTNRNCLSSGESRELMGFTSIFPETIDPADTYEILQPCEAFDELGLEFKQFKFDDLLENLKSFKF